MPADPREPLEGCHLQPAADFLGAFGVLRAGERVLMVRNRRWIHGRMTFTWDLPGGRVEPRESLAETLRRELAEETGLVVHRAPENLRFAFFQEGERLRGGERISMWRSFFFEVDRWEGTPRPGAEVLEVAWMSRSELQAELRAPYHDSFLQWLERGGVSFWSRWEDEEP